MKIPFVFTGLLVTATLVAQESVNLQLKWWHQFQFAGYYAAQIKGFYAEEGLDVTITQGGPGINPVESVTSDTAQFGISGSDLLLDFTEGKEVVALGAIFQHSPYTFLTLQSSGIVHPADLPGKKVMVCDEQGWAEMKAALILEGINPDSISVIKHSWNNNDLIEGRADAISAYTSAEPWQIRMAGYETYQIRPVNYGIDFYGDILFTSRSMVENHPETVQKVRSASFRGWAYALEHMDEMVDYILTLPGVAGRGVTREQLLHEALEMRKLILPEIVEIGHMNSGRWKHILATYSMLGLSPAEVNIERFVYDHAAIQEVRYGRRLLYGAALVLLLLVIFATVYMSMKKIISSSRKTLESEINTRRKAQEKLNLTKEMLDTAINGARLGVWTLDVESNEFRFNNMWHGMLGYDHEMYSRGRQGLTDLIHPADLKNFEDQLDAHLHGKSDSFECTIRMKTREGHWKWILSKAQARERDHNGMATRVTGIHVDLDEIKNKESQLISVSAELLRSNKELRQFSHVLSHNMRAPVATIAGLLQVIPENTRQADSLQIIDKIEVCTQQLLVTMHDLNDILEAKEMVRNEPELITVQERVMILREMFRDRLDPIGAKLIISPDISQQLHFPPDVFDGIILNFLSNAIRFRKENTPLRIEFFTSESRHFVHLHVRDNGIGMDLEKIRNRIFKPYNRFSTAREGKGLGLYISKMQIESFGGTIEAESRPGAGTTFTVSFPREETHPLPASEHPHSSNLSEPFPALQYTTLL